MSIFFAPRPASDAFRLLRKIGAQFRASTINEHDAFDFSEQADRRRDSYAAARLHGGVEAAVYYFFIVDFFFPLFASLFLALVWTALLQAAEMPTPLRSIAGRPGACSPSRPPCSIGVKTSAFAARAALSHPPAEPARAAGISQAPQAADVG
ncbi:hypothetical protein [Candidatus Flexifilum breve]|uniref:hypothetical protein n=1 Tax=Candidatus Flexifilum breve TaxID=3140694 RepID=UPI0031CC8408